MGNQENDKRRAHIVGSVGFQTRQVKGKAKQTPKQLGFCECIGLTMEKMAAVPLNFSHNLILSLHIKF